MSRARRPRTNGAWRPGVRLGIDVGKVRVGVAKSDPAGILATPLTTLRRDLEPPGDGVPQDIAEVVRLVELHESVEVVVGLPVNLAGTEGPAAEQVRVYARLLAGAIAPVPVRLADERMSTVVAAPSSFCEARSGKDSDSLEADRSGIVCVRFFP